VVVPLMITATDVPVTDGKKMPMRTKNDVVMSAMMSARSLSPASRDPIRMPFSE